MVGLHFFNGIVNPSTSFNNFQYFADTLTIGVVIFYGLYDEFLLFLVAILGIKIANFNKTPQPLTKSSNSNVLITECKIESINVKDGLITIVVNVSEGYLEVSVVDIKDGILLNQFFIEQKKKPL